MLPTSTAPNIIHARLIPVFHARQKQLASATSPEPYRIIVPGSSQHDIQHTATAAEDSSACQIRQPSTSLPLTSNLSATPSPVARSSS